VLWKWAGLGHYGKAKLERAQRLNSFAPGPLGLHDGFLLSEWVDGKPAEAPEPELLDAIARYLDELAADFRTGGAAGHQDLAEMIRVNAGINATPPQDDAIPVAGDGRMLPHEWIRTARGWIKTDALDHHDDHFFPGCRDIAWDVAGTAVEFDIDPEALIARMTMGRDRLRRLMPFYRTAYLAWRAGYTSMAARALVDSADGRRFKALETRYRAALTRTAPSPTSSVA
jgi:hypothetical protein